ncbi:MAG TPA: 30S ribosomal protein S3 [Bryobacterales bacterium]|nr:30S ribosomal protein S3 [Bryobacterales bacterium]
MGQKVHPYGFRLGYTKTWSSRWFAKQGYVELLKEDIRLKATLRSRLKAAGISSVEIDRPGNRLRITIRTARPGIVIGRRGSEIEKLKAEIQERTKREVYIDIQEVHRPELDAQLVSESVALQIEKRVAFRRAMRKAVDSALRFGCKGIKIWVAGRLNGHEIARTEWYLQGRLPLQTLRADIDYGFSEARTTYGVIGVKCWIYRGEIIDSKASTLAAGGVKGDLEPARRREARSAAERERERIRASRTTDRGRQESPAPPAPAAPAPAPPEGAMAPVRPPLVGGEPAAESPAEDVSVAPVAAETADPETAAKAPAPEGGASAEEGKEPSEG